MKSFPHTQGFGYFHAFGKTFPFVESDPTSKRAAMTAMNEHAAKVVERRQRYAGHELSVDELVRGVHHAEDRDARTRIADDNWRPFVVPVDTQPTNPFANDDRDPRRPETREQFRKRMAKEWDVKLQSPAAPDKEREALVAEAEAIYEQVLFDPTAPMSAVVRAEQRVRQARLGDIDHARSLVGEYRDAVEAQRKDRVTEIDQQINALRAQRNELAPPTADLGGKRVRYLSEQETREFDERRRAVSQ
jgi:hypothetical protein